MARAWGTTPDVLLGLEVDMYGAMIDVLNAEIEAHRRQRRRRR